VEREMNHPKSLLAKFDLDKSIRLRWALRDIGGGRSAFLRTDPDDQKTLIEMGLVKIQEGLPSLTNAGLREIE